MSQKYFTKAEFKLLERVFAADIAAAMGGAPVFQTRSKLIHKLEKDGFVKPFEATLPGKFPVTLKGWTLTMDGHFSYCMNCEDEPDEPN